MPKGALLYMKSTHKTTGEEPPKSSAAEDFDAAVSKHQATYLEPAAPLPLAPPYDGVTSRKTTVARSDGKQLPPPESPMIGATCPELPDSHECEFPRMPHTNQPDWAAAIAKYDPLARVVPELFPHFHWENEPDQARRYFKKRRKHQIQDRHLRLLQQCISTMRSELASQLPQSMSALITGWPHIIPWLERHAASKLENLEVEITDFFEGDSRYALAAFSKAKDVVKGPRLEELKHTLLGGLSTGLRWPVLIALAVRGEGIQLPPGSKVRMCWPNSRKMRRRLNCSGTPPLTTLYASDSTLNRRTRSDNENSDPCWHSANG